MKLEIDATQVADQLAECEPGDLELLTIEVVSNDGVVLKGVCTEVEHLTGEENYPEEEAEVEPEVEPAPTAAVAVRKKPARLPKAIVMISK